jgi:molecular chaperone GrpE
LTDEETEHTEGGEEAGHGNGADSQFERRWSKKATAKSPILPEIISITPEKVDAPSGQAADLAERLQRAMADLSNYRKRVEAEKEEMAKMASMFLVAELLPVLDNFERALESIPEELQMFSWLQGIALIERHLGAILERQGVESIEAVGQPFNPSLHEAIVEEETTESPPGTVVGELQRGYTMHGHVLRPTLTKVARAPGSAPNAGETNGPDGTESEETAS